MISKAKLKQLAAYRQPKRCADEGLFTVEGPRLAAEALAAGADVVAVCAAAPWLAAHALPAAAEAYEASEADLERLSLMQAPNQVWMLLRRRAVQAPEGDLVLALDRLQDPGNVGTLLRTADWFGVRRVVCSADTASLYNPKVVQASMGAVFRTQVDYVDLAAWLRGCGREVWGASLQGQPLPEAQASAPARRVLLIGNEGRGISPQCMQAVTRRVLIPNLGGTAESLNAAVAAGILMAAMTGASASRPSETNNRKQ